MNNLYKKILTEKEQIYNFPIKTLEESDNLILDNAKTTGMSFLNQPYLEYPKFWRNENFNLPFKFFETKNYNNSTFKTVKNCSYYGEGSRINIIQENKKPKNYNLLNFDKVFSALNFAGNTWQHFIQDVLPIIIFNKKFLSENSDVVILLYEGINQNLINFIFKKLNLKNKLFFIPLYSENICFAKTLYNFESQPNIMPCWWWNFFFYKEINKCFLENEHTEPKNVIYTKRTWSRKFANESDVISVLKKYCNEKNLNFIEFEAEHYSIEETFYIFKNAHTVIGPHGGANYNIIFVPPKTKFIEYVFIDMMYTLYNIAASLELNYYLVPNRGTNHTSSINVDLNKLNALINL